MSLRRYLKEKIFGTIEVSEQSKEFRMLPVQFPCSKDCVSNFINCQLRFLVAGYHLVIRCNTLALLRRKPQLKEFTTPQQNTNL